MNALLTIITFLILQTISADCVVCIIGNYVRKSDPVLSVWSLDGDSHELCTEIKLGGVTVFSKSAAIPNIRLPKQLRNSHFSSSDRYICQTSKEMGTVNHTVSENHATGMTGYPSPTSSFSSEDTTKSSLFTSSLSTVVTSTAKQSSSNPAVTSAMSTLYSNPTIPFTTSSFTREGTTKSSFFTSSLSPVVTSEPMQSSTDPIVISRILTSTYNPFISSTAEANEDLSTKMVHCPHRYEASGEGTHCYQLIYDKLMFANASDYCQDIQPNAHLVSFGNQTEESWVVQLIHNMTDAAGRDFWIGLKNAVYTWEDGSYLSYANFGDKYTDHGGECLYMDVSKESIWKGGQCDDKKEILCEYEVTELNSSCSLNFDNSCYEIQTMKERAEATQICKDLGQYVVQIETAGEQDYLNNVLMKDVWIGLLKDVSAAEITYVWGDRNNTAAEYSNFGIANSVTPLPHGGICHRMKQDDSYSWNEDRCDTEHSFICEWSLE